ncbi:TonB-dependent siderophore receptor [Limimaricola sp. G21655-S1]|uniref:TonB-dependent siderophore receptor n=1 Tax=Limimaricola sp. G21655-S1 TaxID=3014768 RepID=UPI0022AF1E6B|nr:TonB-dependent siderophore receptor [Limimaricola sp. G21655-S1]MCZ4260667.1 TonB-dependent siderophore receptor [Limimaricola sp. G21655-S1]
MLLRRTAISICALMAAFPAAAQDIELDPITVEGEFEDTFFGDAIALDSNVTKTGAPIALTPRAISVVTEAEMAERGAQDVEQALQYSAGVFAGEFGLDNRSDWYLVRGFRPATFHDGLAARYGYYNDTKPEPFLLSQIGVLRGPASGLYGNGEVGGVVNTSSKTSAENSENIARFQIGSHERRQVGLDVSHDLNGDGSLRSRIVALARDSETQVEHSRDDAFAIAPSITWEPQAGTKLTLLGNYQENQASPMIQFASRFGTLEPSPDGRFLDDSLFVGEPGFDRYDSESRGVTLLAEHRVSPVWSIDARARATRGEADYRHAWWAFDNFETNRYNSDGTINRTFYRAENELETFGADVTATAEYALGSINMQTLFGLSYNRGEYDSDTGYGEQIAPIDPFDPVYPGAPEIAVIDSPASTVEERGLYVQNRATFDGRLHLDTGLRYGEIETGETTGTFTSAVVNAEDNAVSGNVALLYAFDNGVSVYGSYAESFRQEVVGLDAVGDPFEPTRGEQYEVGMKYQPLGTNSLYSVALFDLTKSNLTIADTENPGFQIQTGEATVQGIELEAQTRWRDLRFDANFTMLDTENVDGNSIATVAETFGSGWVTYAPEVGRLAGWELGVGARFAGDREDGDGNGFVPDNTLYDARVAYGTDDYEVSLNLRNLTDDEHFTNCDLATCYFGEGRDISLTASVKF